MRGIGLSGHLLSICRMKPLRPLQLHGLTQVYYAVASSSSSDHEAWEKFVGRSSIIIIRSRCLEKVRGPQHRARHHRRHHQITRLGKGSWAAASCSSSSLSSSDHEAWRRFMAGSIVLVIIIILTKLPVQIRVIFSGWSVLTESWNSLFRHTKPWPPSLKS